MNNPKRLAELLTKNIMVFHDAADYSGLEKNSKYLLIEMGYQESISRKIAKNIKNIYIFYDEAQLEYKKGNFINEIKLYEKAKKNAKNINKLANSKNDSQILVDVVINWRHGKKISAILKFFEFWKRSLPIVHALFATYYQLSAAYCHDKRNIQGFEYNFLKIYEFLVAYNGLPVLF